MSTGEDQPSSSKRSRIDEVNKSSDSGAEFKERNAEEFYGHYVWPCAVRLAEWIYANPGTFENKVILELGCGVGLAGLSAAKVGAKKVIFTDRAGNTESIRLAEKNCIENGLSKENVCFGYISWGLVEPFLNNLVPIDIILISDGFYDPSVFDDLIFTVKYLLSRHPNSCCIFTYQIRSTDWSIENELLYNGMRCEVLDFDGRSTGIRIFGSKKSEDHSIVVAKILLDSTME